MIGNFLKFFIFENLLLEKCLKGRISIDADSGPPRYVLWCCNGICHQVLTFFQIGCGRTVSYGVPGSNPVLSYFICVCIRFCGFSPVAISSYVSFPIVIGDMICVCIKLRKTPDVINAMKAESNWISMCNWKLITVFP